MAKDREHADPPRHEDHTELSQQKAETQIPPKPMTMENKAEAPAPPKK